MNKTLKNIDLVQLCITVVINVLIWIALTTYHNSSLLSPHQTTDKEFDSPSLMRMVRSAAAANRIYDGPRSYKNIGSQNGNGNGNNENVNKNGNRWNRYNGNCNGNGICGDSNNANGNSNIGHSNGNSNVNNIIRGQTINSAFANIPELYNTFIMWGVTSCPGNAFHMGTSTTGSAVVTGSKYLASDMMCLPDNAKTRDDVVNLDNKTASTTYPVYRPLNRNPSHYAPLKCAFCSDSVNHVRTIFGTTDCPSKWEKYYSGYLMTKEGGLAFYMAGNYCVKSTVVSRGESRVLEGFKLSYVLLNNKPISCAVCAK